MLQINIEPVTLPHECARLFGQQLRIAIESIPIDGMVYRLAKFGKLKQARAFRNRLNKEYASKGFEITSAKVDGFGQIFVRRLPVEG